MSTSERMARGTGDDRSLAIQAVRQWLGDAQREDVPFEELASSLYLFARRLYENALRNGVKDLFFFAREGQLLQRMFDIVQSHEPVATIRSHYLKVSRRSTFLLSLCELDQENFDVLFRQYRSISIAEFLKSLALDEHVAMLADALGVELALLTQRSSDLPQDPLFGHLLKHPSFRSLYETERIARSNAFGTYVAGFTDGRVPEHLHVVDVGWKGSIQDNLFNWLRNRYGEAAGVSGYYIGLVASGSAGVMNIKSGLLFSCVGGLPTPGYFVFNENRSLFEVLLHANHGSAQRYIEVGDGEVVVVEDTFDEGPMIEAFVEPVAQRILVAFTRIAEMLSSANPSDRQLLEFAVECHARLVFSPSQQEIDWIRSLSHVENFGVFEASIFDGRKFSRSVLARLRFAVDLFRRHHRNLGFWPWLTIEERAIWGMSSAYRIVRMHQTRRTLRHAPSDR